MDANTLADELEALAAKATAGPYDDMNGQLVRAIRGDLAVPILEARTPIAPTEPAPTVRYGGKVLLRANTHDARYSYAMKAEQANVKLAATLLNNLPSILAALRAHEVSQEKVERVAKALYDNWCRKVEFAGIKMPDWERFKDKDTWRAKAAALRAMENNDAG